LLDNNCDIPGDAITVACKGGYKDIVEMLIKHNVDINFSGGWLGVTPIYFACLNGHTDVVQILLDNKYIGVTPSTPPLKIMSTLCFINISTMSL
jgi:ankyrin repeat protein